MRVQRLFVLRELPVFCVPDFLSSKKMLKISGRDPGLMYACTTLGAKNAYHPGDLPKSGIG